MRAFVVGDDGALIEAVVADLRAMGADVLRGGDPAGRDLLVTVSSVAAFDTLDAPDAAAWQRTVIEPLDRALTLGARFAAAAPAPERDATGEPRAMAQIIHVIDQVPDIAAPRHAGMAVAAASLVAMTRIGAHQMAPRVRVNAIVPSRRGAGIRGGAEETDPTAQDRRLDPVPGVLLPTLRYLVEMPAITGQILELGGAARPAP